MRYKGNVFLSKERINPILFFYLLANKAKSENVSCKNCIYTHGYSKREGKKELEYLQQSRNDL